MRNIAVVLKVDILLLSGFGAIFVKADQSDMVYLGLHNDSETARRAPISQAQENALKRIAQLTDIEWQPVLENTMPSRTGFFSGEPVTGVPYSSAQHPGHRIGYDISLETFMTAVQNPKSVLYTENLSKDPYNVPNSAAFYGLACSSLAQYAFRDDVAAGTSGVHANPEAANMAIIEEQSADGVELLALLNTIGGGHQEIVTGITFSGEEIVSIELTELVFAGTRRRDFTPDEFNN